MTIRPVDFATIQRTTDVSQIKQQQDTKPMVEQQNIQVQLGKNEQNKAEQVRHADDAQKNEEKFDAREEGKNKYMKQGDKKKKDKQPTDGKVTLKAPQPKGFDMSV